MATFSIKVSEKEDKLVRSFAEVHGISLNDLFKEAVLEKIEDEKMLILMIDIGHRKDIYT